MYVFFFLCAKLPYQKDIFNFAGFFSCLRYNDNFHKINSLQCNCYHQNALNAIINHFYFHFLCIANACTFQPSMGRIPFSSLICVVVVLKIDQFPPLKYWHEVTTINNCCTNLYIYFLQTRLYIFVIIYYYYFVNIGIMNMM